METRARRAVCERASALPSEVWQLILSFLSPAEAIRAALVCSDFASISSPAAQQACGRLWPQHAHRIARIGAQRFLRLIQAHEGELAAHPEVTKAKSIQKTVCSGHRQIAVEWLIEVSWDWQLESTVVYRGTQYLDHYLAAHAVPALNKFQMLAISCLRTALKHSSKLAERERQRLPCKHWAEVTDGACTEAEVRSTCTKLDRMLHQRERSHPNAKQRLRYLWYRLHDAGIVRQEHVYVYMLASFLLHLSLLDNDLSAVIPTKLATAALSLALKVFGFSPMPAVLEEHCFYVEHELLEIQQQLERAQEEVVGQQLRALWVQSYSYVGTNPSQQPAYSLLQQIVSACGKLTYLAGSNGTNGSSQEDEKAASAASAAGAAATAEAGTGAGAAAAAGTPELAADAVSSGHAVNRVMTRAAAAAGLAGHPRQQHVPTTVAAAPAADHSQAVRTAAGSSHASSSRAASVVPTLPTQHTHVDHGAVLATPQRVTALGPAPLAAVAAAAAAQADGAPAGHIAAATPPAAALLAATHPGLDSSGPRQQLTHHCSGGGGGGGGGGSSSSARRAATRELPPRRAVACSRYGMLASRGAHGTPAAGDAEGSSQSAIASAGAAGVPQPHASGSSTMSAAVGICGPSAAAGPSGLAAAAAGPSTFFAPAAAAAVPPAGSMTPASPKHAAAGTRGLAALFAGVGHDAGNSSHAGMGSNTSRLLSGLSSLQAKLHLGEVHEYHQGLMEDEPAWLWSMQEAAGPSSYGRQGESSKAGASSSGAGLQISSVPVLRCTRRAAAAAAAAAAATSGGTGDNMVFDAPRMTVDRPGVHTRSSSGDGGSSR